MSKDDKKYDYDVVFSLAGEKHDYVEKVAKYLADKGIKVWYYKFKQVDLWGKNQIDAFSEIFTKSAKHCVIFVSKEYTQKVWPNLERQFIQSRWLKDPEYLLPARFDDSLVIGIPDTIGYINLEKLSPKDFTEVIIEKIKGVKTANVEVSKHRTPKLKQDFNPLDIRNEWIFYIIENFEERVNSTPDLSLSHDEIEGAMYIRIQLKGEVVFSMNIYKKAHIPGDDGISFYGVEGNMRMFGNATNAWGNFVWSKEKGEIVLKLFGISFLDLLPGEEKEFTKGMFVDAVWDKVCDILDKDY